MYDSRDLYADIEGAKAATTRIAQQFSINAKAETCTQDLTALIPCQEAYTWT